VVAKSGVKLDVIMLTEQLSVKICVVVVAALVVVEDVNAVVWMERINELHWVYSANLAPTKIRQVRHPAKHVQLEHIKISITTLRRRLLSRITELHPQVTSFQ
jgi:hypothetical protein